MEAMMKRAIKDVLTDINFVKYSFYGIFAMKFNIKESKNILTAAVQIEKSGKISFLYNKKYFDSLSREERIAVFIHECLHLINKHFTRQKKDQKLWNIATDIAINQYIKNLPKGALLPDRYVLPMFKSAEYYYDELKNNSNSHNPEKVKNDSSLDSHPDISEIPDGMEDVIAKNIDSKVKVSVKETNEKYGVLPGDIQKFLSYEKLSSKISYLKILKKIVNIKESEDTIRRRNRRFLNRPDIKGKVKREKNIAIRAFIDVSASMSDKKIQRIMTDLYNLKKKHNISINIIQFDTKITNEDNIDNIIKNGFNRIGYGGTDINCIIHDLEKNKPEIAIVFSDFASPELKDISYIKSKIIWVETNSVKKNAEDYIKGTKKSRNFIGSLI